MNLFTEKEFNNQSQYFAFRLRNLYLKNKNEFYNLQDFIPFPIYINERETLNHHFFSQCFFSKGKEIEDLFEIGFSHLKNISNFFLLEKAIDKAKSFHKTNDFDSVCNYLQIISLNNKMTPYYANKILINKDLSLNTTLFPTEHNGLQKIFKVLIPSGEQNLNNYLRFQTLTKREKEVLILLAKGETNRTIGDLLFISSHSVHAHRRNIYKKLDINKTTELVRLAIAMELFD